MQPYRINVAPKTKRRLFIGNVWSWLQMFFYYHETLIQQKWIDVE